MKKVFILLFVVATVIGIPTRNPFGGDWMGNVAYAASEVSKSNTEKFKAEFAYDMAQITAKIVSAQTTNVENFRMEFAYATAQVTAKVMPMLPSGQRNQFAYEMAQITTKIISSQNLDIEKVKAEFAYEIAQLTTKIITNADEVAIGKEKMSNTGTNQNTMLLRNNASIEPKAAGKMNNAGTDQNTTLLRNNADIEQKPAVSIISPPPAEQKPNPSLGYIAPETYTGLIDELQHVGSRQQSRDKNVNVSGELRFHSALNSGPPERWGKNSSGIRAYLGADTEIDQDWRAYGMLEGRKSFVNYDNELKLSHLYVMGKVGTATLQAGLFGYLMGEGNIYDSSFKGVRYNFGGPVKYTVSGGAADYTQGTFVATARYDDFDYGLEAGVYHYQMADGSNSRNTIGTLSANYNFSNFSLGAMYLGASLKDGQGNGAGYVYSLNYGDLKSWRPGTYNIFAKYYDQPRHTYIAHGMNGRGGWMNGFTGFGIGMNKTLAENLVAGVEYFDLEEKTSGAKGKTLWGQITRYF